MRSQNKYLKDLKYRLEVLKNSDSERILMINAKDIKNIMEALLDTHTITLREFKKFRKRANKIVQKRKADFLFRFIMLEKDKINYLNALEKT